YPTAQSYPSYPSKTVSFAYDVNGRMTNWNDGTYSGAFTYDDTNRTRTVTVDYGPFSKSFTYHYDLAGRKTSFTGPDSVEIIYSYDAEGRLTDINIPGEGTIAYSANQYGQLSGQTLPGGNSRQYGYDPLMNLVSNAALDSAQNMVMCRAYSRNLAGNISGQNTEQGEYSYGYDVIDQLTNVNIFAYTGPAGIATSEAFAYDPMGNRLASSSAITTNLVGGVLRAASYSANNLNQYTQVIETTNGVAITNHYSYDLNGNRSSVSSAVSVVMYSWDSDNRLISISNQQSTIANYTYDPFGRRLSKVVNGITNYFLYADEGLIAEYDGEGNLTREYGYTPDSLWMNNLVFMRTHGQTTNYYYAINDHLGAVQKLVANNGSVVWSMAQDAFGRAVVSSNSSIICNLRFSSQYYDEESGLHQNTMRYYDPVSGRYISRDLLQDMAFFRTYARNKTYAETKKLFQYLKSKSSFNFTDNQPTYRIDTEGLSNEPVGYNIPTLPHEWVYIPEVPIISDNPWPWDQLRVHGKYCGPGWTGGNYVNVSDFDWNGHVPWPDDALDDCCLKHDACYAGIDLNESQPRIPLLYPDIAKCDKDLLDCAKKAPPSSSCRKIVCVFSIRNVVNRVK
ncbi:MAG: RHS repeat-associated core domain-containing protein, partial [Patescibacteria group bacterium]